MSNLIDDMALQVKDGAGSPSAVSSGGPPAPIGGWLRAGRKARGVSQQQLAEKLGFKRQAWAQLEASEAREAISLYSLRRAADALGYDLVYYLAPRDEQARESAEFLPEPIDTAHVMHFAPDRSDSGSNWNGPDLPTELR